MKYTLGSKTFRNILFAVILVLGVALSIIVSGSTYYAQKKLTELEFNEAADNRYSAFKRELDSDLSVLASLQALYYSSENGVERAEFRNFTSHILKQHASIQALEWIPYVPGSQREAYEQAAKKEGLPDFQFTERIAQGTMKRAEKRQEYFPVYYVEPYKGNEIALGFDLASNPTRLEALEGARKTGEMRATARVTLVQETKSQFGVIVFAPIYRNRVLINSEQTRWENLEGFALGVFRIGDMVEKAENYLNPEGVDIFIYDESAPVKERYLYTHSSRTRKSPMLNPYQPATDLINSKTLEVAGRKWMVIYAATPGFIAARSRWLPWGLLLAGLLFTGLVIRFLFFVSHAEHVEKYAKDLSDVNTQLEHEIMERKRTEEALRQSQEQYRLIVDAANEGIWALDGDRKTSFVNPQMARMLEYEAKEMIGREVESFIFEEDMPDHVQKMENRRGEIAEHYERRWRRKDGQAVWTIVSATPIIDALHHFRGSFAMILDITERKKLEQQLLQAQKMEAVGLLAGGIAHDFNNILTAIIGYGSLLQVEISRNVLLNSYVVQILNAANRGAEVTKSLLAFSRKQMINPKPVDLNNIVRGIEKLLARLIGEDIAITTTLSSKELVCMVDASQIEQVLMNLTTNARDAMPNGGRLTLKTAMVEIDENFVQSHGYGAPGKYAVLSVTDTGIGMDQQSMGKIFDPFFTTKENGKGTGLGLAMVYGIIKQHGGYISVNSEPGKGTTFKIYLPAARSTAESLPNSCSDTQTCGGNETILLAEDDDTVRQLSEIVLIQNGYTVISAQDGEDAVNKFIDHKDEIRLAIIDMIMPKKSGKEAYYEIKAVRPDVKVLFSSGYTAGRLDDEMLHEEGVFHIAKPVSPKDFLNKVREVLDK
ncbi:MAG: CHASE domain-containing protein [Dissulfurispiraceae bacterium]